MALTHSSVSTTIYAGCDSTAAAAGTAAARHGFILKAILNPGMIVVVLASGNTNVIHTAIPQDFF